MIEKSIHKIRILNRYYKITRFYQFLNGIALKSGIVLGLIIVLYFLLSVVAPDADMLFSTFVSKLSPLLIFTVFFISEFLLGFIPPEFFIAWTSSTINPWLHVFMLGTLSYVVGLVAYYLGRKMLRLPSVKNFLERKGSNHIKNLKRWGGVFIFVGAMLPIPYSMVSLTSGLINYRMKYYLLWSLFRYVRFFLYAVIVFRVV